MTELEFRNKVTWFSFALSLLVIWVHSYNAELIFWDIRRLQAWSMCWNTVLASGLARLRYRDFFVISGYQFYRDFDWGKLKGKWQRRVKSLLVPYIVWNFLYYLSYVTASRIPAVRDVVGKGVVELFSCIRSGCRDRPHLQQCILVSVPAFMAGGSGSGSLSAIKMDVERTFASGLFLGSGAAGYKRAAGKPGCADLL